MRQRCCQRGAQPEVWQWPGNKQLRARLRRCSLQAVRRNALRSASSTAVCDEVADAAEHGNTSALRLATRGQYRPVLSKRVCMPHFRGEIARPNTPSCRSQKVGAARGSCARPPPPAGYPRPSSPLACPPSRPRYTRMAALAPATSRGPAAGSRAGFITPSPDGAVEAGADRCHRTGLCSDLCGGEMASPAAPSRSLAPRAVSERRAATMVWCHARGRIRRDAKKRVAITGVPPHPLADDT